MTRGMERIDMREDAAVAAEAETTVVVRDELGLHARPAARIAQAAQEFQSQITISYDDMTVDAKSILDILSLAAARGTPLTLRCKGQDAHAAAKTLEQLFA